MLSETLSNKSVAFTFKATEMSFDVIIAMLNKLLQEKTKEKKGKQSIKDLRRKGNLQVIDITNETIKKFKRYLRKFNLDYSLLKDKTKENQYLLFFRNYDSELLDKVMNVFLHEKFKNKESIKEKISKAIQKKKNIQEIKIDKTINKGKENEI